MIDMQELYILNVHNFMKFSDKYRSMKLSPYMTLDNQIPQNDMPRKLETDIF